MTVRSSPSGNGYESPTPGNATTALAANFLMSRLSELERCRNGGPTPRPRTASLNNIVHKDVKMPGNDRVGIRDRICCFRWTWFTSTMATGGVANVLATIPLGGKWLHIVGATFFIFNVCLFLANTVLLLMRFHLRPGSFGNSFTDQTESLFIPAFLVSLATIFVNTVQYGVPATGTWLLKTMEIMFWIYLGASVAASVLIYLILWSTTVFPIHTMTPVWVFPAYPLLLVGPFAGNLIFSAASVGKVSVINALPIALAAVSIQGAGFCLSFMILSAFVYRLMTQKLPRDMQRPGVFISIGPSGFTVAGMVQLGRLASVILPPDFMEPGMTGHAVFILGLLSSIMGLWLWGLAVWFFVVSVGSFWKYVRLWVPRSRRSRIPFQLTWFSFVFPNTALVTATEQLGRAFDSRALEIVGCCLAGCLVVVWAAVFAVMVRCLWRRELLWPKDDD